MKLGSTLRRVLPLIMAALTAPAFAEGPLVVGGPGDAERVPFRWNPANFPLTYWTDLGNLGSLNNTSADNLVREGFDAWEDVTTASITFSREGQLGADVTIANWADVFNAIENCSTLPGQPSGGIARNRSIVYDNGDIIDEVFGSGNSDFTLGFATATCLTSGGGENSYNRGYAVMNGKGNPTDIELKAIMVHEFGHMLGLDHSQINVECHTDIFGCSGDTLEGLPTMFPFLVNDAAMTTPATDDIAGISELYPETVNDPGTGKVPFLSTTGRIAGRIFFSDNMTQAMGFNVIARRTDNPKRFAVSNTSGFLFTPDAGNPLFQIPGVTPSLNGTRDPDFIGYFEIPGLPPGNYTLEIEAIDSSFINGSGVGPLGGLNIVFPMPSATCPDGEFFDLGEANNDLCTTSSVIPASAGTTVPDRNIILNSTPPRFDAWEDGP